ncbi:hypothetical protein [uncultured Brevibacterium sp.]|uniref:hypothetical protein n=1 Tax=uncultured Brevibacterium sp. TaxID=189678 RepID=UPI0025F2D7FA|nr:hypothetical protein [uncultured Brevibacterium sp.]
MLRALKQRTTRMSDTGLVSVEYLATALIASAIIGTLIVVPVATQPQVTEDFEAAVCRIFSENGGSGDCGGSERPEAAPEQSENPNDLPPTCLVSTTTENSSAKLDIKFVTIEGGYQIKIEEMSDGTLKYTLVGEGEVGAKLSTPTEGAEASAGINGGLSLGDTWIVDPNSEDAAALEQQIRDYALVQIADRASGGWLGGPASFISGNPTPPRDPDVTYTTGSLEVEAEAGVSEPLGTDSPEGLDIPGIPSAEASAQAAVNAGGSYTVRNDTSKDGGVVTSYEFELEAGGSARAEMSAKVDGNKASYGAGYDASMKDRVGISYQNGELYEIRITQTRAVNVGPDGKIKLADGQTVSIGADGGTYTTTTMTLNTEGMTPEQIAKMKQWADFTQSGFIAPDLYDMMHDGAPDHLLNDTVTDFSNLAYDEGQLGANTYQKTGADSSIGASEGSGNDKLGISIDSSISGADLIEAIHLSKDPSGNREVVQNEACLQ